MGFFETEKEAINFASNAVPMVLRRERMKLYKTLTKDYDSYSNYKYTDFKFWLPPINDIKIYERGYHYCQPEDLIGWLSDQIFEIETFGETLREGDKCVAQQIRFIRKLVWTPDMAREFALSCCCALGGENDVEKYRSGIPYLVISKNRQWMNRDIAFDINPYNAARSIGFRNRPDFSSVLFKIFDKNL